MLGGYYLGGLYLGQSYPQSSIAASASVIATFSGTASVAMTLVPTSAAVSATFSASFSPEGLGSTSAVTATYVGNSSGVVVVIAASSGIVATFTGASASGTPVVHLYSTQSGNQFVTDITSYGLHANVRVYVTVGVPVASLGNDGDFAMRRDSTNGSGVQMYHRASGAWTAVA